MEAAGIEDDVTETRSEEMTRAEVAARIDELRTEIAYHDDLYFKQSAPVISDGAYDRLKQELAALRQKFSLTAEAKESGKDIGDDRGGMFPAYRHRIRMLSLNKSYSENELRAFDGRVKKQLGLDQIDYVVEPKFDGLAISVTFENGKLVRAVTRGNGMEGDDVTANVLTIRNLPRSLRPQTEKGGANPIPAVVELRGEIYLSFAEFKRINREREDVGEIPFAIPRNLAAGTIKEADPADVAKRKLEIVFYGIGACEPKNARPDSQTALLHQLHEWGLPTIDAPGFARGADAMWKAVKAVDHERTNLGFPIDGAVVKINAVNLQEQLGATMQAPLWAIAYKFVPESVETQVRSITLQVGRTGAVTPVAELVPVKLAGSTIARVSLFNRDEIRRRDIRVGDFVYVEKAGEIIPSIASVDRLRRTALAQPYIFPANCPVCSTGLVQATGESVVRCPNRDCPEQIKRRVLHFASAEAAAISGLGPALVDKLVGKGLVKNVADLYRLRREDLLSINGLAQKSAGRLLASIGRSKQAELWRVINGLGIPQVGPSVARELARRFRTLDRLSQVRRGDFWQEDQGLLPGIGDSAARSVLNYFSSAQNQQLLKNLIEAGMNPKSEIHGKGSAGG